MVMGHSKQQWRRWYGMQFHPRLAQNAVNMQICRTAMLQIRSDALVAAAELSLSTAPHCRHVIVSDCDEYQSCKSDSMEDSDIELDLQSDADIELDLW